MRLSEIQQHFDLSEREQRGVELFHEYLWTNSEVCNECFKQVRDIGPELVIPNESQTIHTNAWYERTENGSQEHTPNDHNRRFGTCFCLGCGSDLIANHRNKPAEKLQEIAENIHDYTTEDVGAEIDLERYRDEIGELKRTSRYQGWETEILAVAWSKSRLSAFTRENTQVYCPR